MYISQHYHCAVEVGVGANMDCVRMMQDAGKEVRCTDIRPVLAAPGITLRIDDIFEPDLTFYQGADVIYAIRPGVEMVPPLMNLASRIGADLLVYHLGFEMYGDGGEIIDCGVILHRYCTRENPSKREA
jgi:uncharacterized UPF0146 family protein